MFQTHRLFKNHHIGCSPHHDLSCPILLFQLALAVGFRSGWSKFFLGGVTNQRRSPWKSRHALPRPAMLNGRWPRPCYVSTGQDPHGNLWGIVVTWSPCIIMPALCHHDFFRAKVEPQLQCWPHHCLKGSIMRLQWSFLIIAHHCLSFVPSRKSPAISTNLLYNHIINQLNSQVLHLLNQP